MSAPLPPSETPLVTVCRGCCCGTEKKRRGIDHAARLESLRELIGDHARLRVTDCLGPCERADVIVVSPSPAGRRAGGRPVWLGQLNGRHELPAIGEWVHLGGPGLANVPDSLRRSEFRAK